MTELRSFRSPITGLVGEYHPRVAAAAGLIEVTEDDAILAAEPVPQAAETELGHEPAEWAGPSGDADPTEHEEK